MSKKTIENQQALLNMMQPGVWYKASEFENIVEVKESRLKVLLKEMAEQRLIETVGNKKERNPEDGQWIGNLEF